MTSATRGNEYAEITDYGCDWLTLTTKDNQAGYEAFAARHSDLSKAKAWGDRFYRGWSYGDIAFGAGRQGGIIKLSGIAARNLWLEILEEGGAVSRVDWQVTIKRTDEYADYAQKCAEQVARHRARGGANFRITATKGYGAGDTVYVGSRSSEAFARIYDKDAREKTGKAGYRWRHEVELKAEKAKNSVLRAMRSKSPQDLYAIGVITSFLTSKGLSPNFPIAVPAVNPKGKYVKPAPQTTITWLRDAVRPACAKLATQGHVSAMAKALDVDEVLLTQLLNSHYNG